ncbi:MAG: acyl-CoA dehydrogenase family protein [Candidatus Sericytochromatia bacterium]
MEKFIQENPVLTDNQYDTDKLLRSVLKRYIPSEYLPEIEKDLHNLGNRVISDILAMSIDAEENTPKLVQYSPWGKRIDEIKTTQGWKDLDKVSAEEGLIAIGYERKYQEFSRLYQFAKLYIFTPSSAIYTCPLAMTDGATKLIEIHGDDFLKNNAFKHLTSRDPNYFWTSGQWMTEKTGGSDVGRTETIAKLENGEYKLYGDKWFTSSTTSQMSFTLARIVDENGDFINGSRGLSLFYLETRKENGELNNITINRLKDKLGTKALPTAELTLNGTKAYLTGSIGSGIKNIASLFNVTRIYNAVTSVSFMRRGINLSKNYAKKRQAFGKLLAEQPLHINTLADLEVDTHSAFHLVFYAVLLLGKEECGKATSDEIACLRALTPLIKLYTGKKCVSCASEILESFGGAGYVEDTGLPKILRDSQVLTIWEGTTNILSLDLLRSIQKEKTLEPLLKNVYSRLESINHEKLLDSKNKATNALNEIKKYLKIASTKDSDFWETSARSFAYSLSNIFSASLLLEHAQWSFENEKEELYFIVAKRFCNTNLAPLIYPEDDFRAENNILFLD